MWSEEGVSRVAVNCELGPAAHWAQTGTGACAALATAESGPKHRTWTRGHIKLVII